MTDHRSLEWAVDIIRMCEPIRCVQGGMWFNRNHNFADATFVDYGAADAFAVAARALPALVDALTKCAAPFSTSPGSVAQCQAEISAEFQRRMDIAVEALSAITQAQRQDPQ
jgi:hypothetical protein